MIETQYNPILNKGLLISICILMKSKSQRQNSEFYSDLLNLHDYDDEPTVEQSRKHNQIDQTFIKVDEKVDEKPIEQQRDLNEFISKPSENKIQNKETDNVQELPKHKLTKLKLNPRSSKLYKPQRRIIKDTSLNQIQATKSKIKAEESNREQIKQKTLQKLQLRRKLRNLNYQLQKSKSFILSPQEQLSQSQINPEYSFLQKINSSFISNQNPSFNKFTFKSKSDVQFKVRRQSLREKEEVYSPVNHEAAFKLIEKMHAEKLKKHQKIINQMKKKQEKELQTVKRLEQQRKKQKQVIRIRQKVIFYTPKQATSSKINFPSLKESRNLKQGKKNNSSRFFNSSSQIEASRQEDLYLKQNQKEEIGLLSHIQKAHQEDEMKKIKSFQTEDIQLRTYDEKKLQKQLISLEQEGQNLSARQVKS